MTSAPTAWVISDGRRGIENQALGLAEAMAATRDLSIDIRTIQNGFLFRKLPAWTQFQLRKDPTKYFDNSDFPQIAIGCGRQAIAPLLALKRKLKSDIFTVYVQDPRLDPSYFDYVIAPEHDRLDGPNVMNTFGSPNRITLTKLAANKDKIETPKGKTAAWLIGGPSKSHFLPGYLHDEHLELLSKLLDQDRNILVTTSRRTPDDIIQAYEQLAKTNASIQVYTGKGDNPYFAYLHHADMIFVTEDSTNMLTEACATGKPVFRLPMAGNAGKFQELYETLKTRCRVRPAIGSDLAPQGYEPLNETARAAELLWTEYEKRSAPLA